MMLKCIQRGHEQLPQLSLICPLGGRVTDVTMCRYMTQYKNLITLMSKATRCLLSDSKTALEYASVTTELSHKSAWQEQLPCCHEGVGGTFYVASHLNTSVPLTEAGTSSSHQQLLVEQTQFIILPTQRTIHQTSHLIGFKSCLLIHHCCTCFLQADLKNEKHRLYFNPGD